MNQEEILLKVGLDGSNFDQNLARSEQRLESFAEHGNHSFVHVERPARAFHHLLGEIGRTAPFVSESLMGLVNPTTGVIALIGAGFAFVNEKLKEYNRELDEQGSKNKESIFGVKEIREASEAIKDIHREVDEFEEKRTRRTAKDLAKNISQFPISGVREGISLAIEMGLEQEGTAKDLSFKALAQSRATLERRAKALPGAAKAAQAVLSGLELQGPPEFVNFQKLNPQEFAEGPLREYQESLDRARAAVKRFGTTEPQQIEDSLKLNAQRAARMREEVLEHDEAIKLLRGDRSVGFREGPRSGGTGVIETYIKGTHDILQRIEINGVKIPNGK